MAISIERDDLSGAESRDLVALHLAGMNACSPPGHVCAIGVDRLKAPDITFWSVRRDGALAGIGALRELAPDHGEVKSMRTHPDHLRQGIAAALLDHLIAESRRRGYRRLSLETGSGPEFEPAIALYRRRGFVNGECFAGYSGSAFNQFLHLDL